MPNFKHNIAVLLFLILSINSYSQNNLKCKNTINELEKLSQRKNTPQEFLHGYDLRKMTINLNVDTTSNFIEGHVTIEGIALCKTPDIVLQLADELSISKITSEGKNKGFTHKDNLITINRMKLKKGERFETTIYYSGNPLHGLYNKKSEEENIKVTYTVTEPFYAKNWIPIKEDLSDKIDTVEAFYTTPKGLKVGANGVLVETLENNASTTHHWLSSHPIAYYLISFACSDYYEYNLYAKPKSYNGDSILIQNYTFNNDKWIEAVKQVDYTVEVMNLYSELFGLYPFADEKYGHSLWHDATWSGMEHQTMSTMKNFNHGLQAHELAHQWFGCNVTASDWHNIWLHEGFASYAEYLALEFLEDDKKQLGNYKAYRQFGAFMSQNPIYIETAEEQKQIFEGSITYAKSPMVVHMLRFFINNDDKFFNVIKSYQEKYKGKNASTEDFKKLLEEETTKDYSEFFNDWIYKGGFPEYALNYSQNDSIFYISLKQSHSSGNNFFDIPRLPVLLVGTNNENLLIELHQTKPNETFQTPVDFKVDNVIIDPANDILCSVKSIENSLNIDSIVHEKTTKPSHENTRAIKNPQLIYLKPNGGNLTIESENIVKNVTVINTNGEPVLEASLNKDDKSELNISELASNIYLIVVEFDNGQREIKTIKK